MVKMMFGFMVSVLVGVTVFVSCTPNIQTSPPVRDLVLKPAEFKVNKLEITPTEVTPLEIITITAEIRNIGGMADNYTAILNIDGKASDNKTVTIQPSENITVVFSITEPVIGLHKVDIGPMQSEFNVRKASVNFNTDKPVIIQYDHIGDGIQNYMYAGRYVSGDKGHMTRFTAPTYPFKIVSISMSAAAVVKGHGSLQGRSFTVTIWDKNTGNRVWAKDYPWQMFDGGTYGSTSWNDLRVPDIVVEDDFYIEVVTHSDAATASTTFIADSSIMILDYEDTKEGDRSFVSSNGKPDPNPSPLGVNWYIRVTGLVPTLATPLAEIKAPLVPLPVAQPIEVKTSFDSVTYTNETNGFSFKYPKGWIIDNPKNGQIIYVISGKNSINDMVGAYVMPETTDATAVIKYSFDSLPSLESVNKVVKIESSKISTLADGKTTCTEVVVSSSVSPGYTLYGIAVSINKDGKTIVINSATVYGEESQSRLREIVRTLSIK